jgi:hypothetical protein
MPSYVALNSFPNVQTFEVTTSWEEVTIPASCKQVDIYVKTNDIVFDYASTPAVEAPIQADIWFTVFAKMDRAYTSDKTFSLKGTTNTTVYLRFL